MVDKFTLRTYRALKECPQGQQPGEIFEATEGAGDILVSVGAAERVDEATAEAPRLVPAGRHKRRDLRAED
jgi:hypothetical protein